MNRFVTKEFWLEKDKQLHFIISYLVTLLLTLIAVLIAVPTGYALTTSSYIVLFAGWIKEVNDGRGHGTKEIHDLDADFLGVFAACLTITIYKVVDYAF